MHNEVGNCTEIFSNIVLQPEHSVNHSIDACSSVEGNVALLSHLKSDHGQLKTENKELRNNLEDLKLKLDVA